MRVKILETDERLGVTAGEVYEARRYFLDPDKVTLIGRIPDGYDPECNQYMSEVAHWIKDGWWVVERGQFVPLKEGD